MATDNEADAREAAKQDRASIFVRGLPFSMDSEKLGDLFGEIGPVRRAFVVKDRKTEKSRGFGALEDDAHAAIAEWNGKSHGGRRLVVSLALKKHRKEAAEEARAAATEDTGQEEGAAKAPQSAGGNETEPARGADETRTAVRKPGQDLAPFRSLLLWGLPWDFPKKRLFKRVRKLPGFESLEFPITRGPWGRSSAARCGFKTPKQCNQAIGKLDKHVLQSHRMRARQEAQALPGDKGKKRCRLIVRNLAFNATEQDLRDAFEEFGPLVHVHVPKVHVPRPLDSDEKREKGDRGGGEDIGSRTTQASRGFGFVQFVTRPDARAAIQSLNEHKVAGRPVVVDWALPKEVFEAQQAAAKEEKEEADEGNGVGEEEKDQGSADESESTSSHADEEAARDEEEDEKGGEAEVDESAEEEEEGEEDLSASEAMEDDEEESGSEQEGDAKETSKRPAPASDVHLGTTLFIRNVPFDATEEELRQRFSAFGPLKYARMVVNRETGESKGTAFVQFREREAADAALKAAGTADEKEDDKKGAGVKQNEAVLAALRGSELTLRGRALLVSRAIEKAEAERLRRKNEETREREQEWDRRHLYLAREGTIAGGTEAAEQMPRSDLHKREVAAQDKKAKLRSPLMFVSPTRLSVRNLSRGVTDAVLRKGFLEAAEQGMKAGLVHKREGDPSLWPAAGTKPKIRVKEARVMREVAGPNGKLRTEADGVTPRSRGYGFVEFSEHIHALAALRMANNNPSMAHLAMAGPAARQKPEEERPRLIVEFAVENMAKLRQRDERHENARRKMEQMVQRYGSTQAAMEAARQQKSGKVPRLKPGSSDSKKTGPPKAQDKSKDKGGKETSGDAVEADGPVPRPAKRGSRFRRAEREAKRLAEAGDADAAAKATPVHRPVPPTGQRDEPRGGHRGGRKRTRDDDDDALAASGEVPTRKRPRGKKARKSIVSKEDAHSDALIAKYLARREKEATV